MKKTVISIIGITIMLFAFTACQPSVGETAQERIKSAWNAVEHAEGTDLGTEAIVKDSNGDKYLSVLVSEGVFKDITVCQQPSGKPEGLDVSVFSTVSVSGLPVAPHPCG